MQIMIKREPDKLFDSYVYAVYADSKKIGEHLKMDEALHLIEMVESGEVNV